MQNISIIIPNYNGDELLSKNIPHVVRACEVYKKLSGAHIEIIVIDDASSDDSLSVLYYQYEQHNRRMPIVILQNEENLGFAKTVNKAVKHAKGELLMLLNTDVTPTDDFLSPLVLHFSSPIVFAVGCLDKSIEHGKTIERGRGIGFWRRGLYVHNAGRLDKADTAWVSGGSGMFRHDLWKKLHGFNELYSPFYWEDIDLSYRARKAGYTVVFEKDSVVTHRHEEGAIRKTSEAGTITTVSYRNQFIFIWSNLSDIDLVLTHLLLLPYHLIKAFVSSDRQFLNGFFSAVSSIPKIINYRLSSNLKMIRSDKSLEITS